MDLSAFKENFDILLKTYIEEKTTQAKKLLVNPKLNSFIDYIPTFVFSGGKRIRPYCLYVMYKGFGGKQEKDILQFAIIFELLHTMALIHDDIIDQSDKRHNVPTMHKQICSLIGEEMGHIAEGQAMLIGDLLLSWVYELGNKHHDFSAQLLDEARQNVHNMIEEVILGQMIDVDMMTGELASKEMIEKKNNFKTGSYTFIRPMLTGAILAGAGHDQKELVIELGKYLGLSFQLKDDMMDITFGDDTKSLFSDIQEGQQTFFTHYVFENGTENQKKYLRNSMGKKLVQDEIIVLQNLFEECGALSAGKILIQEYAKKAQNVLEKIVFVDPNALQGLNALIEKIVKI